MAVYTNLPVYEETYQLLLQLVTFSRQMQRDFRYTIGEKLQQTMVDIIVLIFKANKAVAKAVHIAEARERLVEAQVMMRVLNDTRQLSDKQYVQLVERSTSVSKQLASWERSAEKKESGVGEAGHRKAVPWSECRSVKAAGSVPLVNSDSLPAM